MDRHRTIPIRNGYNELGKAREERQYYTALMWRLTPQSVRLPPEPSLTSKHGSTDQWVRRDRHWPPQNPSSKFKHQQPNKFSYFSHDWYWSRYQRDVGTNIWTRQSNLSCHRAVITMVLSDNSGIGLIIQWRRRCLHGTCS